MVNFFFWVSFFYIQIHLLFFLCHHSMLYYPYIGYTQGKKLRKTPQCVILMVSKPLVSPHCMRHATIALWMHIWFIGLKV